MHRSLICFILTAGVLLVTSCYLPTDPGPQPSSITETEFRPGMSVLGILRLDGATGSSFIHLTRTFQTEETGDDFTLTVSNADVRVIGTNPDFLYHFSYIEDELRDGIYSNAGFVPVAGRTYHLEASSPEFPTVRGSTVVPEPPAIETGSLTITESRIAFTLTDPGIRTLLDVHLISQDTRIEKRISLHSGNQFITLTIPENANPPESLSLYLYDRNLADYLSSAITIKPQAYQEPAATVTGGYGCFGAVSVTTLELTADSPPE